MNAYLLIIYSFVIIVVNYFLKKNNLLANYSGENHQKFLGKKTIPLSGGLYLLVGLICIFFNQFILFGFFFFLIFIIGLTSDLKLLNSPKPRFLLIYHNFYFYLLLKIKYRFYKNWFIRFFLGKFFLELCIYNFLFDDCCKRNKFY